MNIIETAKDLIKKGKELNDYELVQMGYELLAENSENHVETEQKSAYTYLCTNCNQVCESDKERKQCPNCRKRKLTLYAPLAEAPVETVKTGDNGVFNFKTEKSRTRINPDTQEEEGTYTRAEQINVNTKCIDTGEFEDDKLFNRQIKFSVRPRRNKPTEKKNVCNNCNKEFVVSGINSNNYLCNRCIMRKVAR